MLTKPQICPIILYNKLEFVFFLIFNFYKYYVDLDILTHFCIILIFFYTICIIILCYLKIQIYTDELNYYLLN